MGKYLITLAQTVLIQLLGVFGIFFLFGFVLSKIEEQTHNIYRRTIGWKGILFTAWIGTPIHELGHVFFVKLFHHKVNKISLFQPNEETGGLGHVDHSFSKYSLYQRIGNFFIGAAPMIFGSIVLVTLLYFLVPTGKQAFLPLTAEQSSIFVIIKSLKQTLFNLFAWENLTAWNFWLFLYISFCIASHIAPSKKDRQGMWGGLLWLVLILILVNAITLSLGVDITKFVLGINQYLGILIAIFTYALIISVIHFVLAKLILLPFKK